MQRRALLAAFTLPALARGQGAWPSRDIRAIVPFTPAGQTDTMARLLGARLAEALGRPVVVENRAGGNGLIGAEAVARAAPDGHTWLVATLTHAINATLFPNAGYDFRRDLVTVSLLGTLPLAVTVRTEAPFRTLADLAQAARTRPMNGGSSGIGTPPHLGLEMFRRAAGAGPTLVHVPYRGGAPAVTDLVAGNLDVIVGNLPEVLGQIQAGRLRALAVTAPARHPLLPAVPTAAEAGMPDLVLGSWTALMVPAGTPPAIIARLGEETRRALADPATRARAMELGFDVVGSTPDEGQRFVLAEVERLGAIITQAGIKPE
jgi:tripartite-type tricarboxylate transporter receptor subunit TctC